MKIKPQTTTIVGEIEFKLSDNRFASGRIYMLLLRAVVQYPEMSLAAALTWAKELDTKLCSQEVQRDKTYGKNICHSIVESLEKANHPLKEVTE